MQFLKDSNAIRFVLWEAWTASGHDIRHAPSIDRIDSKQGYIVGNLRWVPHWVNSSEGGKAKGVCKNRYLNAGKA